MAFVSTLLFLAGCQGTRNASAPQVPINLQNLSGSWEVVSISLNGMTVPSKMTSAANEAGYKDGFEKLQYQISESKIQMISSDELAVTFALTSGYHLSGRMVVPENTSHTSVSGFEVLSLSADSMTIKPNGPSQPAGILFNLSRIDERDLAPNKLKPIPVTTSYAIKTPTIDVSEDLAATFSPSYRVGDSVAMYCSYRRKSPNFQLNTFGYHMAGDGTISSGGNFPSISFGSHVPFDFSKSSEEINFSLAPVSEFENFQGVYVKNGARGGFQLDRGGNCAVNIKRVKRHLDIAATCIGVSVTPYDERTPSSSVGSVTLKEHCVLGF
jgi:hypothetical protein